MRPSYSLSIRITYHLREFSDMLTQSTPAPNPAAH
ncbi:hypothetical protein VP381E491_P0049 [Vibrio phage 381E49-1]|nr:hypothetical protein VP381E491_P0049 [Vibrio phage 381E49-1]